jgi:hypothetical protein
MNYLKIICAYFSFHLFFVLLSFSRLNRYLVLQDTATDAIQHRSQGLELFCAQSSVPMIQTALTLFADTKARTGRTDGLSYEKPSVPHHQHPAPYHR